jgi:TolB-like protein
LALTAAALLFALIFAGGIWHFWPVEPPPAKPSLAVLPFDNLGGDEATGRLADGVTEDIITDLTRFPDLDVIARNSTEVYKGKPVDVRQVGKDLGIGYVLEGSIQRQGDQVRITAQLIDTGTGAHVWSNRWDRPIGEVFAVQSEVSEHVAAKLAGNVIPGKALAAARRKLPEDLEAYDLVLLAYEAQKRGTRADIERGLAYVDAAIARDPSFARAYMHKAWLLLNLPEPPERDWNAIYAEMERLARKSIELDPNDFAGYITLAFAASSLGRNDEARASIARALELNPSSADALNQAAEAMPYFGEPERGVELCDRSFRLNPNPPPYYYVNCGPNYFFVGRHKEAASAFERWAAQSGKVSEGPLIWLAMVQAALGQDKAAAATMEDLRRLHPNVSFEYQMNTGWVFEREQELGQVLAAARKIGLRICATKEELAAYPQPRQLPECEAERAKAAVSKT